MATKNPIIKRLPTDLERVSINSACDISDQVNRMKDLFSLEKAKRDRLQAKAGQKVILSKRRLKSQGASDICPPCDILNFELRWKGNDLFPQWYVRDDVTTQENSGALCAM